MFSIVMLSLVLGLSGKTVVPVEHPSMVMPVKCQGCGCKGGPGWRINSTGKCASNRNIAKQCGYPPSTDLCTQELFNPKSNGSPSRASAANAFIEKPTPDRNRTISGRASVVDADTIEIHGIRIRIWGIDAPESQQTCLSQVGKEYHCGQIAANQMASYVDRAQPVTCEHRDTDRYGRMVASCQTAKHEDIASWLVQRGHALDWPLYSRGKFTKEQATAKALKAGVWQGRFIEPWVWRAQRKN